MLATWSTAISHESIVDAFINTYTTVTQTCVNTIKTQIFKHIHLSQCTTQVKTTLKSFRRITQDLKFVNYI